MEREEVFQSIVKIAKDIFENDSLLLTESSTAADVEEWDSLTHLSLVNELEEKYHVRFTFDEVTESKNLGEILNALMNHISKKMNRSELI